MAAPIRLSIPAFDRREFLGAAMATAALPAASLIPAGPVAAAVSGPELVADWTIDDQWMGYPRPTDPIGCGRQEAVERPEIDPADEYFVSL